MVVGLLVLLNVGLNPFGSLAPDRPWSRCGSDLCACTPTLVAEPYCPLCPVPNLSSGGSCDDRDACGGGAERGAGLVRTPDRLGGGLPMIAELLTASLVLRLGSPMPAIAEPSVMGAARIPAFSRPDSRTIAVEPGPPRAGIASA